MIRYKRSCKVCIESKRDPKFRARVYHAAFKRDDGDESIYDIAHEYQGRITQASFYNHIKKHVTESTNPGGNTKAIRLAKKTEIFKAEAQKELETSFSAEDFIAREPHEIALDNWLAQAAVKIEQGELPITTTSWLQGTKIKADIMSKKREQTAEVMKAIYKLASGEQDKIKENNVTRKDAAIPPGGTDRSDSLHYEGAWDALTQGTNPLYTGNSQTP